jgi:hypothetical protein
VFDRLPASLEWAVAFRLERLAAVVGRRTLHAAFGVPEIATETRVNHVILTSAGALLGRDEALESYTGAALNPPRDLSLADRFSGLLGRVRPDVECIGVGEIEGGSPVLMTVSLGAGGRGSAEAWFASRPTGEGWELLPAIGVRALGRPIAEGPHGPWHVRFSYSLAEHLEAARLARFTRTANCNRFFLLQGALDQGLQAGIRRAGHDRLAAAALAAYDDALAVAQATADTLMTACSAARREAYGDLVPLGMLLPGVRRLPPGPPELLERGLSAVQRLRRRLCEGARDGGWPFQAGAVTTGLDSALVLLGLRERSAIPALERFRERTGGYAADRAGTPGPSTVAASPSTEHWRGPDVATTALARALRRDAALPETTPASWLEQRFDERGSAFIACPWLLDWMLALGLAGDRSAAAIRLRGRLIAELLASRSEDGTFGRPDERILATACACAALDVLGVRGRTLALAQLALMRAVQDGAPVAVPFFSAVRCELRGRHRTGVVKALLQGRGVLSVDGTLYSVTTYEDSARAVTAGLVALALSSRGDLAGADAAADALAADPRYRCRSVAEYIARFALPAALSLARRR